MKQAIQALPDEAISHELLKDVCDQDPIEWGAAPTTRDDGLVYAFLIVTPSNAHGIGFDEDTKEWQVIESVDRNTRDGPGKIEDALQEWAKQKYPDDWKDIAPEFRL